MYKVINKETKEIKEVLMVEPNLETGETVLHLAEDEKMVFVTLDGELFNPYYELEYVDKN